jgi:hypothetical protein
MSRAKRREDLRIVRKMQAKGLGFTQQPKPKMPWGFALTITNHAVAFLIGLGSSGFGFERALLDSLRPEKDA